MLLQNDVLSVDLVGNWISRLQFKGRHFMLPRQQFVYHLPRDESVILMRGGSHPCCPVFGPAPAYPDMPRHGWLRDEDGALVRHNNNIVKAYSHVGGTKSYPWVIKCNAEYQIIDNALLIKWIFTRQEDDLESDPPFNLALHHYWINPMMIRNNLGCGPLMGELNDSSLIRWKENIPVELDIHSVGKVSMSMNAKGDNHIVIWSDRRGFFCVEQLVDDPNNFGTACGLRLESNYIADFKLEFFD